MYICDLFNNKEEYIGKVVKLNGWVRNHRKQKNMGFIDFYDGTIFNVLQVVYDSASPEFQGLVNTVKVGCCIEVEGKVVVNENNGSIEISPINVEIKGECDEDYPIQPKRHTLEFLRENAYLRPRTRLFQAVFKVRSVASMAIHEYFQNNGYVYVHTPLLTSNDAEGAGNTFTVTTYDPLDNDKKDYADDFFGKHSSLAVTGQLEGETFALAFSKIYTFGPTFRAENSNTRTHAAEFWMIEPEIAFADLFDLMDVEEDFLKSILKTIMDRCPAELEFLEKFNGINLRERMTKLIESEIVRLPFKDAITILKEADATENFKFKPEYDEDLAREHEKYLTEKKFNAPVFVYDWPKEFKAFYMYQNDDGSTVAAVDLLVPDAGELMGGSQRETRYDRLIGRMNELGIAPESLDWYCNLRKYGGCTHSGFGMGFERLLIYVTGMENIRDVIPYCRTPKNCDF